MPITDIVMENVKIRAVKGAVISNVSNIKLSRISIVSNEEMPIIFENVKGVIMEDCEATIEKGNKNVF
jgi:hypothetical protein